MLSHIIKEAIQRALQAMGYEIHRVSGPQQASRATTPESLRWLREHGFRIGTVLDVGASDGRWSAGCMVHYPDAEYVLFEPQPVHSRSLDDFAARHGHRVRVMQKAVGEANGHAMFDSSDPMGGVLHHTGGASTIEVEVTTLDNALVELDVRPPFLLKLDTHGVERGILEGAATTLPQCEALVIEAYAYRIGPQALLFWELCAFLAERGFRVIDLADVLHRPHDNSLWQMDLTFIRADWPGFQNLAFL